MPRFRSQNSSSVYATLYNHSIGTSYDAGFTHIAECYDEVNRRHPHSGSDGLIMKREYKVSPAVMPHTRAPGGINDYGGSFVADIDLFLGSIPGPATNLQSFITEGYNKTKPGKPQLGLGVTIGELRDLPLLLRGRLFKLLRTRTAANAGAAYLEWQFGYKQLIRDIRGLYTTWHRLDATLRQLMRDANKPVRRTIDLKAYHWNSVPSLTSNLAGFSPINTNPIYWVGGDIWNYYTVGLTSNVSYVATFKYDFPLPGDSFWSSKAKRVLFGLEPSLALLWNIIPWTWLSDWFLGIGPILERLSETAVENLRVKYQYAMWRYTENAHLRTAGIMKTTQGNLTLVGDTHASTTTYLRQGESLIPFAEILPAEIGLDLYQLAILAALGLSSGR